MSTFSELRAIAAEKRDKTINAARREFDATIQKIADLESTLNGKPVRNRRNGRPVNLTDLIFNCLPEDKPVSINDVCGLIRAADPERKFSVPTIRTILNRMKQEGIIKHVSDAGGKRHVAMQAIFFAFYNFCRVHSSLDKRTPAMAAGLSARPLKLVELLG